MASVTPAHQTTHHTAPPGGGRTPSKHLKGESNIDKIKRRLVMNNKPLTFGRIFLFLTGIFIAFLMYATELLKFQDEVDPIILPRIDFQRNHSFCSFRHLSPEEAVEENLLLNSIAWPKTPPLLPPRTIKDTSDPAHSSFGILPREGGGQWLVGDRLKVMINMFDYYGRPKKYGGDVLFSRLHNHALDAGVAGEVLDHLNGTYSVVFPLLWEGSAQVEVTLLHPSEAVAVLRWLNREQPDRIYFMGLFQSGSVVETPMCSVCLRPTGRPLCNYTDLRTGEPWFCYKPRNLGCDHRIKHTRGKFTKTLSPQDAKLFERGVNLKVFIQASGPTQVTVLSRKKGQSKARSSSVVSGASGFYHRGVWRSLGETPVHQFSTSAVTQCLRNNVVHMYGDSTIRQWFEHLIKVLPDLREFDLHNPLYSGPRLALDYVNSIMVTYRCHGPPIRFTVPTSELRYIANELDGVAGGANTVVAFGIWAHLETFPIEIYIRRLMSIRRAVVRLLARAPDTVIIVRNANPKNLTLFDSQTNSDWYSMRNNKALQAIFKGLNVHLVDAWEMTLAHKLPHVLHPEPPIIHNMMNVILSSVCSTKR